MIFGSIVAGGTGSRMNIANMPKQFLPFGKAEKPVIIHTLEKFLMCPRLDYIYLGIHPEWVNFMEDLLIKYDFDNKKIKISHGGPERNDTIMNIIEDIEKNHGESNKHIIVTHDAVRPFVTLKMIEENIDEAIKFGACDTVITSIDTAICSENGEFISSIPSRKNMFLGQTPQSFNMSELKNLYNSLSDEEKLNLTDACGIFITKNKPVRLVMGDVFNVKITTNSNFRIAEAILENRLDK